MTLSEAQSKIAAVLDLLEMSENVVVTDMRLDRRVVRTDSGESRTVKRVMIETEKPGEGF
jgi:hypothetical protein